MKFWRINERKVKIGETMGYRSEVGIMCEKKAYKMFKEAWEKVNFKPHKIYRSGEAGNYKYALIWSYVKWYKDFGYHDVDAIEEVKSTILKNHNGREGYHFQFISIGEDYDMEQEETVDAWKKLDFGVEIKFTLPEDIVEITNDNFDKYGFVKIDESENEMNHNEYLMSQTSLMNEFEKVKAILKMGIGRTSLEDENKVINKALNHYAKHLSQQNMSR